MRSSAKVSAAGAAGAGPDPGIPRGLGFQVRRNDLFKKGGECVILSSSFVEIHIMTICVCIYIYMHILVQFMYVYVHTTFSTFYDIHFPKIDSQPSLSKEQRRETSVWPSVESGRAEHATNSQRASAHTDDTLDCPSAADRFVATYPR